MNKRNFLKSISSRVGAAIAGSFILNRASAQTKTELTQIKYPLSPGPSVTLIMQNGSIVQTILGPSLIITDISGVKTLNAQTSDNRSDAQQLTLEPDNLSWKVPITVNKPRVFRNGLRMFLSLDYILEFDAVTNKQVIRPTIAQGMKTTDIWLAE